MAIKAGVKMKYLWTIFLIPFSSYADFSYETTLQNNGVVSIETNFSVESDLSLNQVMKRYVQNETYQKNIDSMMYAQEIVPQRGDQYKLRLTAQKKVGSGFFSTTVYNTLVFNCTDQASYYNYETNCNLDTSSRGEDSGDRFEYARYSLSCERQNLTTNCTFTLNSKVKAINVVVYKRSEEYLGAAGIQSYLDNMYSLYASLKENKNSIAKPRIGRDNFYKSQVKPVRSKFNKYLDKNQIMSRPSVTLKSN